LKTFFTLEQPEQWGYQDLLENANFLVMPANENGLTILAEQIKAERWQPAYSKKATAHLSVFPFYFNDLSQWWLERHAPARAKMTELLKQVHDFLGEDAYYWFSACAVYPELRWHLTLYLGSQIKTSDGNQLLTNDNLAKLARLPWFRYGYMPNWLRRRLVDELSLEQDKAIRSALDTLLNNLLDKPISDFKLEIVYKPNTSKLRGWQLLSKWVRRALKKSPLHDYVFLSFMPSKLAVSFPKKIRELVVESLSLFSQNTMNNKISLYKIKQIAFSLLIVLIALYIVVLFFNLLSLVDSYPVSFCEFPLFKDFQVCKISPCSRYNANTVECADSLFAGENYHNPANLQIETLRDVVPSISFRIDDTMLMRFRSDRDGYVFVFNIEPDGKLISFFPNRYCRDLQQSYIKAGQIMIIPDILWPCEFPITEPRGTGTLLVVLIEETMEYNVLPLAFKQIEVLHAKSLLHLLRLQLENMTLEDENGNEHYVQWSVKMVDYNIIR